ncbi:hypothetical protein FBY35_5657 [Streptomyces sp. SLBN-118]|uniref:COG1470 family protein n=1 Tax=Streptomyces sp. SLBN-118 TaxID=2768454 RepID=UPI001154D134|nr:hypothetical protein [Streptomyces sp. SLBN-118]TQK44169.1 hypothetical protein FBY35_5657 [Streptomyces sp. SLBN-118]
MTASASLDMTDISIEPGSEVTVLLQVRNTSDIVEAYSFDVLGEAADWMDVEPASVSLYPGNSTTATVKLHPPRSWDVPAGEVPFGVRVQPAEFPQNAVIPEGVVRIEPFHDTSAELLPQTSHGRWAARHQLAVDNRGNVPVILTLTGADPAERLRLAFRPATVAVEPGHAAFVSASVRPNRLLWRGEPLVHPFQLALSQEDAAPVVVDGTYLQKPLLPKWIFKVLLILLALLLVLAAIWFGLLKPTVKAAAREAVAADPVVLAAREEAAAAREQAAAADDKAGQAMGKGGGKGGKGGGQGQSKDSLSPVKRVPFSLRLPVSASAADGTDTEGYTVPKGKTLQLTDMVLENPQGDAGTLVVARGGEPLLKLALENFRDQDHHWVTPIHVPGESDMSITITCRRVGNPVNQKPSACHEAMYLGGVLVGR